MASQHPSLNDTPPHEYLPCYEVTADPFEQQGHIDQISRDPIMKQAFADISSNSDQIGSLLNPQDVTVQAMMTVYAPIIGLMSQLSAHQRYNSREGNLFQRNILLCVAMICDAEITFREVGSFASIFTDIIRLDGKLSTIGSFEHVEDKKIHFTLHDRDHPIDVCWDLQSETTILTIDDHPVRSIVGDKAISRSMSEIFSGLQISPSNKANFLFPLVFQSMSFPFFCVSEVRIKNPIRQPNTRVSQLLKMNPGESLNPT